VFHNLHLTFALHKLIQLITSAPYHCASKSRHCNFTNLRSRAARGAAKCPPTLLGVYYHNISLRGRELSQTRYCFQCRHHNAKCSNKLLSVYYHNIPFQGRERLGARHCFRCITLRLELFFKGKFIPHYGPHGLNFGLGRRVPPSSRDRLEGPHKSPAGLPRSPAP